jgi:hypothetical protein
MSKNLGLLGAIGILLLALFVWLNQPLSAQVRDDSPGFSAALSAPQGAAQVFLPLIARNYVATAPLWRFGVVGQQRPFLDHNPADIAAMRFGWTFDFSSNLELSQPYGIEYVAMISVKQIKRAADGSQTTCCVAKLGQCASASNPYWTPYTYTVSLSTAQIQSKAQNYPGKSWVIGNEIERIDMGGTGWCMRQDEMLPELYAQAYHDIYYTIKNADPTAQVSPGALVQFTPLRQVYLQRVWDAYKSLYSGETMPADFWTMHFYVLNENNASDFPAGLTGTEATVMAYKIRDNQDFSKSQTQIELFRTWLKANGHQNKPVITNEFGVLFQTWVVDPEYPSTVFFTPQQVRDYYMYPAFNYLLYSPNNQLGYPADGYRMVQRWGWWSLDMDHGFTDEGGFWQWNNGNLFYSGLNGVNLQGMSAHGTYWKQYVQPLPAGSTRPYAPVRTSQGQMPRNLPGLPSNQLDSANCTSDPQLRLRVVETLLKETPSINDRIAILTGLKEGVRVCSRSLSQRAQ